MFIVKCAINRLMNPYFVFQSHCQDVLGLKSILNVVSEGRKFLKWNNSIRFGKKISKWTNKLIQKRTTCFWPSCHLAWQIKRQNWVTLLDLYLQSVRFDLLVKLDSISYHFQSSSNNFTTKCSWKFNLSKENFTFDFLSLRKNDFFLLNMNEWTWKCYLL